MGWNCAKLICQLIIQSKWSVEAEPEANWHRRRCPAPEGISSVSSRVLLPAAGVIGIKAAAQRQNELKFTFQPQIGCRRQWLERKD
uniref:Uncharacterized protein n=1 Tax=Globodera rostochiensis TaxID=31243 RepID=A0A914HHA1_GLORO